MDGRDRRPNAGKSAAERADAEAQQKPPAPLPKVKKKGGAAAAAAAPEEEDHEAADPQQSSKVVPPASKAAAKQPRVRASKAAAAGRGSGLSADDAAAAAAASGGGGEQHTDASLAEALERGRRQGLAEAGKKEQEATDRKAAAKTAKEATDAAKRAQQGATQAAAGVTAQSLNVLGQSLGEGERTEVRGAGPCAVAWPAPVVGCSALVSAPPPRDLGTTSRQRPFCNRAVAVSSPWLSFVLHAAARGTGWEFPASHLYTRPDEPLRSLSRVSSH